MAKTVVPLGLADELALDPYIHIRSFLAWKKNGRDQNTNVEASKRAVQNHILHCLSLPVGN